jgi:hypothetical protein
MGKECDGSNRSGIIPQPLSTIQTRRMQIPAAHSAIRSFDDCAIRRPINVAAAVMAAIAAIANAWRSEKG